MEGGERGLLGHTVDLLQVSLDLLVHQEVPRHTRELKYQKILRITFLITIVGRDLPCRLRTGMPLPDGGPRCGWSAPSSGPGWDWYRQGTAPGPSLTLTFDSFMYLRLYSGIMETLQSDEVVKIQKYFRIIAKNRMYLYIKTCAFAYLDYVPISSHNKMMSNCHG